MRNLYKCIAIGFLFCATTSLANRGSDIQKDLNSTKNYQVAVFPNPIQTKAIIEITLQVESDLVIEFFDLTGKKVKEIRNQHIANGRHQFEFDSSELKSGVYLCKISTSEWVEAKRIVIRH